LLHCFWGELVLQILLSAILADFAAGQTFYRACPQPSEHFVVVVAGVWVYPCTHSITTFKGPQGWWAFCPSSAAIKQQAWSKRKPVVKLRVSSFGSRKEELARSFGYMNFWKTLLCMLNTCSYTGDIGGVRYAYTEKSCFLGSAGRNPSFGCLFPVASTFKLPSGLR